MEKYPEINAAPRVNGFHDHSNTCNIMICKQCGSKVWVNKRFPSDGTVHCIECAKEIVRKRNSTPDWVFRLIEN